MAGLQSLQQRLGLVFFGFHHHPAPEPVGAVEMRVVGGDQRQAAESASVRPDQAGWAMATKAPATRARAARSAPLS